MQYNVYEDKQAQQRWQLHGAAYEYRLLDRQERELFAYHWHPEGHSRVTFPHLHVAQGRVDYAGLLAKAHFPTGTIALRDVLRLMTEDFGVRPRREDWASVLASGNGAGG